MSKLVNIKGFNYPTATVRKDLQEDGTAVPVGKNYYSSSEPLPYRWKDEEFQIYLNGKWQYSESIDWEFE